MSAIAGKVALTGKKLIHNAAGVVSVAGNLPTDVSYTVGLAAVSEDSGGAGVVGFNFLEAGDAAVEELSFDELPGAFTLEMAEGVDLLVALTKHRGDTSYFFGVTADKVLAFEEPTPSKHFHAESTWSVVKLSSSNALAASRIENTESKKIADKFELILAHTPLFKERKLTTLKLLAEHGRRSWTKNVQAALTFAEKHEREAVKAKADASKDKAENKAAAAEAAERWSAMKACALSHSLYLDTPFADRFICVGDHQSDTEVLAGVQLSEVLLPGLKTFRDAQKLTCSMEPPSGGSIYSLLASKSDTSRPKRICPKPVPLPEVEAAPPAEKRSTMASDAPIDADAGAPKKKVLGRPPGAGRSDLNASRPSIKAAAKLEAELARLMSGAHTRGARMCWGWVAALPHPHDRLVAVKTLNYLWQKMRS